nr:sulfur carrier protein ThiS adenylyltransferase ThiF [uncultured Peptostreptococcus sp.]
MVNISKINKTIHKGSTYVIIDGKRLEYQDLFKRNINCKRELLKKASVCVLGLGGLGSNIAVYLARSGIGKLLLVDFDCVEPSNLNRQYYSLNHIGMKKTQALVEIIRLINPFIDIETIDTKIDINNIDEIVAGQNIVCEALDDPTSKSMLVSEILSKYDEKMVVAASGMAGIGDANMIRTEKKFKRLYLCGDERSDFEKTDGMMAPRVSICAGHQANIIIRLIMGLE